MRFSKMIMFLLNLSNNLRANEGQNNDFVARKISNTLIKWELVRAVIFAALFLNVPASVAGTRLIYVDRDGNIVVTNSGKTIRIPNFRTGLRDQGIIFRDFTEKDGDELAKAVSKILSEYETEAARKEAAQKEAAQKEAAQKEAAQKEAAQKEAVQKEAVQKEAARKEAAQKEAAQKEAAQRETAQKWKEIKESALGKSTAFFGWVYKLATDHFWSIIGFFASAAALGHIFRIWYTRHPRVVILGKQAAGKTAVVLRLSNPEVSHQDIRDIPSTASRREHSFEKTRSHGKFTLHLKAFDSAGAKPIQLIETLSRKKKFSFLRHRYPYIIVSVLAQSQSDKKEGALNQEFIIEQKEYIKIISNIVLNFSKKTIKPKGWIVFINKADLGQQNCDELSLRTKQDQLDVFKEHFEIIKSEAKSEIDIEIIVGSALHDWGINLLLDRITHMSMKKTNSEET